MHSLKIIRVLVALTIFSLLTLYFIDFTGIFPNSMNVLAKIQWVPALLSFSPFLILLALLSLFFGRVYCSAICPLEIYQDIIIRIKKRLSLKKVKYEYKQPHNFWRYIILTCVILSFVAGSSGLLLILDPYSIYGRIITTLIRPLILLGNNLAAFIFNTFKISAFPVYSHDIVGWSLLSIIFASVAFLVVTIMAFTHGRLYCNLLCPVGSFLGILSRASFF